jgi:SAM-dependent methyltransferase
VKPAAEFRYQGNELDVFAHAKHWKRYWAGCLSPWIAGDVLEAGAGIGTNTALLLNATKARSWLCLEPDPELASRLASAVGTLACTTEIGTIQCLKNRHFDTILYIDVLEHVEKDRQELSDAAQLLRPNGHLIVLSPAHNFLFSEFDTAIGHYRRYNRRSLMACSPDVCRLNTMFYLDCAGMVASLVNRLLLRQSTPTLAQIGTWDRFLVPISQVFDPLIGHKLGKTIIAVWQRMA